MGGPNDIDDLELYPVDSEDGEISYTVEQLEEIRKKTFTDELHRGPSAGTVRVGKNNVGTGKVVMGRHDPARSLLTPRRIVRLVEHQLDDYDAGTRTDKDRGAFIVEGSDDIVLRDGRTLMGEPGGAVLHAALAAVLWGARVGICSVAGILW